MRPDIAQRAEHAINEAVNSALAFNPGLARAEISIAFDELKLDADVDYAGVPLEIGGYCPVTRRTGNRCWHRVAIDLFD